MDNVALRSHLTEGQLRTVIESSPVSTQFFAPDGTMLGANRAWEEFFGFRRAEFPPYNVLQDRALEERGLIPVLKQAFEGETVRLPATTYVPLCGPHQGCDRWFAAQAFPVRGSAGAVEVVVVCHYDVTEQKRADELQRLEMESRRAGELAKARLAALVDSSDDAIISKTLEGIITSWNQGATRILGYLPDEIIGKSILTIIPPELHDEERVIISRLRAGQRIEHYETIRIGKHGRRVNLSLTVSPIKDSTGTIIGASKIARDITERKRAEQERDALLESERHARGEAERASQLKDEFLATLSHELRTPLNAILGWTQILRRAGISPGPDDLREGLGVIERNCRVQVQLVEDLLDMSRIVAGKLKLNVSQLYLAEIISAALESLRPAAEARGVRLVNVSDPAAGPIRGDAARLQQVVWNLLSNGIKFTPRGGSVQVALQRVDSHVQLSVSDTGQGIKPDFLPHVFDRFRQADASTTRRHGGLGLGLSIVRHLVELHGGTVRAASPGEGKGATFTVNLPLMIVHEPHAAQPGLSPTSASGDGSLLQGVRVLVVDDEADARDLVRRVLEESQAEVCLASSADEALSLLRNHRPHVVVSDIGMPDHDGYEFIRWVRALSAEQGGRTPAAALTAFARSEDRRRALLSGYQTHVAKPVEPAELVAVVASLAGKT